MSANLVEVWELAKWSSRGQVCQAEKKLEQRPQDTRVPFVSVERQEADD